MVREFDAREIIGKLFLDQRIFPQDPLGLPVQAVVTVDDVDQRPIGEEKSGNIVYALLDANAAKTVNTVFTDYGVLLSVRIARTVTAGTEHSGATIRVYQGLVSLLNNVLVEITGVVIPAGLTPVCQTVFLVPTPFFKSKSVIVEITPTGGDATTACTYVCEIDAQMWTV